MKCPKCGENDARVIDSRSAEGGSSLRRRRQCTCCEHRFSTVERVLASTLFVIKKDGRREEFDSAKLRGGIIKACNKRPVSLHDVDALVADVEAGVRAEGRAEIEATEVGARVMDKLYHLDQVAYVRFASVYQVFDDVKLFAELLERMTRGARRQRSSGPSSL